jgi:hypothetical protein
LGVGVGGLGVGLEGLEGLEVGLEVGEFGTGLGVELLLGFELLVELLDSKGQQPLALFEASHLLFKVFIAYLQSQYFSLPNPQLLSNPLDLHSNNKYLIFYAG